MSRLVTQKRERVAWQQQQGSGTLTSLVTVKEEPGPPSKPGIGVTFNAENPATDYKTETTLFGKGLSVKNLPRPL
jgi:hypothetical protein